MPSGLLLQREASSSFRSWDEVWVGFPRAVFPLEQPYVQETLNTKLRHLKQPQPPTPCKTRRKESSASPTPQASGSKPETDWDTNNPMQTKNLNHSRSELKSVVWKIPSRLYYIQKNNGHKGLNRCLFRSSLLSTVLAPASQCSTARSANAADGILRRWRTRVKQ